MVLDTVVETLRQGGVDQLVVVIAPGEDRLSDHCTRSGLAVAVNQRVARGMLSSIHRGLDALTGARVADSDTVTICPVDFPSLRAGTVADLLSTLATSPHGVVVPKYRNRRGHPMVFHGRLAREVRGLDLDRGLRALLESRSYDQVEVDDPGVLHDLDTWMDYLELTGRNAVRKPA